MVALSLPTGAETLATSQNGEVGLPGRLKKRKKKCTAATQVAMGGQKTAFGKALLKGSGAGKEKIPLSEYTESALPIFVFFCPPSSILLVSTSGPPSEPGGKALFSAS